VSEAAASAVHRSGAALLWDDALEAALLRSCPVEIEPEESKRMSESETVAKAEVAQQIGELQKTAQYDMDAAETQEWLSSLDYVLKSKGPERVQFLIDQLRDRAAAEGVPLTADTSTPYVNTIPLKDQPPYPGNRELERRIKSIIRWNAMAMVVRGNKRGGGIGGHISTFASSATLYEVAFNHFFKGRGEDGYSGDSIYFQGHASHFQTELGVERRRRSGVDLADFQKRRPRTGHPRRVGQG